MILKDREEAGRLLCKRLERYKNIEKLAVLGIPRGAMSMAQIIARELAGELGAVLVHKIGAPGNEEFAIGCVGLSGHIYRSPYASSHGISEKYIEEEAQRQLKVLWRRQQDYGIPKQRLNGKTVIIVDDGISTGATTLCAVHEVKALGASKVVLACAVSSRDAARHLREVVDEFIALDTPADFFIVGQFFSDFRQVSDEEVVEIFNAERNRGSNAA